MTLEERIAQIEDRKKRKPMLRIARRGRTQERDCIHRLGGELLPTLVVSRGGAYIGGPV